MIYELLYTSVPKGLKRSKGYCNVLTTEGIPSALLERLADYCGYRHLLDPGSPDNPIAYGHRIVHLAGNTWHILSRVADAGFDYSGRSNLIAHFMAISQDELKDLSAGPTSLMMSPEFFRIGFDGEPRRVSESETRKRLGNVTDKAQKALTWATVTGHAGWAGRLVQVTEETSDSIALVYPLRTNTLKLLDEAASILHKHKQWDITFNTFFTKTGEQCRWRCYCANVDEASDFKGKEFDMELKRKGEPPQHSEYVEAAENGKKLATAEVFPKIAGDPKQPKSPRPPKPPEVDHGNVLPPDLGPQPPRAPRPPDLGPQPPRAPRPPDPGPQPPPIISNPPIELGNSHSHKSQSRDTYKTPFLVTVPALLFIIMILVAKDVFVNQKILTKLNTALVEIPNVLQLDFSLDSVSSGTIVIESGHSLVSATPYRPDPCGFNC